MTTERHLLSGVETVCRQIGYGRTIQAIHARWALMLHKDGMELRAAVRCALITDTYMLSLTDEAQLLKELSHQAGMS